MKKILILGIGNYMMSDDGLSVHVLDRILEEYLIADEIDIVEGGTCDLELLQYLDGITDLIIIDAIKSNNGVPGSIVRLNSDQIPAYLSLKISLNDIGLPEFLATAKLRNIYPENVVILGIQPASLEMGVELSPEVAANVGHLIELIKNEVSELIPV